MSPLLSNRMLIATDAWGEVPRWVLVLVEACDAEGSSQNKVAKRLGYSAPVVSQIIRKDYKGDMIGLEKRVLAIFDPTSVKCPALEMITTEQCITWQDKASELNSASPLIVRMFAACRRCPRFTEGDDV